MTIVDTLDLTIDLQVQQTIQIRGEGQQWSSAREVRLLRPGWQAAGHQLYL